MATPNTPRVPPVTTNTDVAPGLTSRQVVRLSLLTGLFASGNKLSPAQIEAFLKQGEALVMDAVR